MTAVDNNGNIVLIEIKRDHKDIEHHREAFEFQVIRYATSYSTIDKTDDYFKSNARGQEFVLKEDKSVLKWAKEILICGRA